MIKLKQNSKMKKDGIHSFGILPVKTCPMAGDCKKFCYAQKGFYKIYPNVRASLEVSTDQVQRKDFIPKMVKAICKTKGLKKLRIHTEGDFYNQKYLDKWVQIAKIFPEITFYCYTKSLHLNWTAFEKLSNTKRIQSEGGKLDHLIDYNKPHARIFKDKSELKSAGYTDCSKSDLNVINPKTIKVGLIAH